MRWQFLGLLLIGVVAAVCAAILVASLKTSPILGPTEPARQVAPADVPIVIATHALDRRTKIDASMMKEVRVPAEAAPEGAIPSSVAIVGKILVAPVVEGQPFTKTLFAGSGPGVQLAATLPDGMRAMSVSLSDYSSLDGLLYPGCAVDVLASFDLRGQTEDKDAGVISTTILRSVQVLAIEDKTAVSGSDKADERSTRQDRRRRVTLMVTPKQSQQLQLAMEHGVISLAMRNPEDAKMANSDDRDMVSLRDFGPNAPAAPEPVIIEKPVYIDRPVPVQPAAEPAVVSAPKPVTVTVFKGGDKSEVTFQIKHSDRK